jgi:hypothetical protein
MLTVAGLAEPQTTSVGTEVSLRAPGFTARFANATVSTNGTTIVVNIGPKP